jgi:hypothetical protein
LGIEGNWKGGGINWTKGGGNGEVGHSVELEGVGESQAKVAANPY